MHFIVLHTYIFLKKEMIIFPGQQQEYFYQNHGKIDEWLHFQNLIFTGSFNQNHQKIFVGGVA